MADGSLITMYDEEQQNLNLLCVYLYKLYTEPIANELLKQYRDNLFGYHGLAWSVGKEDFEFFNKYFLQDTFTPKPDNKVRNLAPVHIEIWHELQQMFIEDKWDKEEFILPRGSAKSTIINKDLTCYIHCYKLSRYTVVMGNKAEDAIQFIADTRDMISNPYIEKAFGKLIDKNDRDLTLNKQEIELTNCTKIEALSLGSSIRGTTYGCKEGIFRPSCIILDDILKKDDILTDAAKEKVVNTYYNDIAQAGDTAVIRNGVKISPATKFLVIGTPLAADDFINTIKNDPTYRVFHKSIVNFNPDEYFEHNKYWQQYYKILQNDKLSNIEREQALNSLYAEHKNEMNFPTIWEKFTPIYVANNYFVKRTAFMQELMCDCECIGQKWFKSIATQSPEDIESHNFVKTMLCIDPANSLDKKADFTAMLVGSVSDTGFRYIRKGIIKRFSFDDYCMKVIDALIKYPDITHIDIEKNTYLGADVSKIKELIDKTPELKGRSFIFINEMQRKNKDEKISTIIGGVNNGQIIFNEEDKEPIQQVKDFAGQDFSEHDKQLVA